MGADQRTVQRATTVVLSSDLQESSAKRAPAKPRNKTTPSPHNCKNTYNRELETAAKFIRKQQVKAAKTARLRAREERDQARKEQAEKLAARQELRRQQRDDATP
jgi:hypothetical protein